MPEQIKDLRFMGLAGTRVTPPGEFLTYTLPYLGIGLLVSLCASVIAPIPFVRQQMLNGLFLVPLWSVLALVVTSFIAVNFYYGYLTKQPYLDALEIYTPKVKPCLHELFQYVVIAAILLLFIIFIGQSARLGILTPDGYKRPASELFANPWLLIVVAYPIGGTFLILEKCEEGIVEPRDLPHIWLSLHGWTYSLPGLPTTANTTASDLRKQLLADVKETFSGRHSVLGISYSITSVIIFCCLFEWTDYSFALCSSPIISLWSLWVTLAVCLLPLLHEISDIRVQTEDEEHEEIQDAIPKAVLVLETVEVSTQPKKETIVLTAPKRR